MTVTVKLSDAAPREMLYIKPAGGIHHIVQETRRGREFNHHVSRSQILDETLPEIAR